MPLKLKKSQTASEPSSKKDDWSGPWGRISPEPQSVLTIRFIKKSSSSSEETYSYPYCVLSSWRWRSGVGEEELKIEASSDLVTVKGRGLDRLVEALDQNALETLCEAPGGGPTETADPIWVSSICISRA
ncbi:MAG: hypothetical protein LV481_11215 [Methylacidiphilales bacterium]|nr:hypothetical protein [Candidatus Methylacidiphilales bacterium]